MLAHSDHEVPADVATFDDALELLAADGVGAHVDLKQRGLEEGVGAWYFGVFHGAGALLADLGVPEGRRLVGAVALGYPAADDRPSGSARTRPRRPLDQVVHRGRW